MQKVISLRGALLVVAALAAISGRLPAEAAERLSASTQKMFDAVWSDNLAGVKASVARGADVTAINEFGVRAVDMAVDKGHFDIAHYLLSVERLSREYGAKARTTAPPTTAVPSSQAMAIPVSPVVAASLPPEPAPTAVIVKNAAMPASRVTPVVVPATTAPSTKTYWTPSAGDAGRSEPALRVVSVAKSVKIPAASTAPSEKNVEAVVAEPLAQVNPLDEKASGGVVSRIGNWFSLGSDEPKSVRDTGEQVAQEPVDIPQPEPPVLPSIAEAVIETPKAESVSVAQEEVASNAAEESRGGILDRIDKMFSLGGKKDQTTDLSVEPAIEEAVVAKPVEEPVAASPALASVETPVEVTSEPTVADPGEQSAGVSEQSEEAPGVFERLAKVFESRAVEEEPVQTSAATAEKIAPEPLVEPSPSVATEPEQIVSEPQEKSLQEPPVVKETLVADVVESEPKVGTSAETSVEPLAVSSEKPDDVPSVFERLAKVFESRAVEEEPVQTSAATAEKIAPEPLVEPSPSVATEPEQIVSEPQEKSLQEPPVEKETLVADAVESAPKVGTSAETSVEPLAVSSEKSDDVPSVFERLAKVFERRTVEEEPVQTQVATAEKIAPEPLVEPSPSVATEPVQIVSEAQEKSLQEPSVAPDGPPSGSVIDRVGNWFTKKLNTESSERTDNPEGQAVSGNAQEPEPVVVKPAAPLPGEKRLVRPAYPVETASRRAEVSAPNVVTPLDGIILLLDDEKRLGATLAENDPRRERCVDKRGWDVVFCIEPAFWPKDLAPSFDVQSVFYRGNQAIVRYVGGRVDQYHALFASHEFESVVAYFRKRYGEPTETPEIWSALIGQPKRLNPTRRWISKDPGSGEETILEIRQTDDLRWSSPPDLENGMVRLSRRGARSVFELLTATDIMLANIRVHGR